MCHLCLNCLLLKHRIMPYQFCDSLSPTPDCCLHPSLTTQLGMTFRIFALYDSVVCFNVRFTNERLSTLKFTFIAIIAGGKQNTRPRLLNYKSHSMFRETRGGGGVHHCLSMCLRPLDKQKRKVIFYQYDHRHVFGLC